MYLNQSSSALDKENAGTPARTKIMTTQSTPMSTLKTPGRQCSTPMRRPLSTVNQDVRVTPRMLSKPPLTPRPRGTPKLASRTLGKKSSTARNSLPNMKSQTERTSNLEQIVNNLTSQIMKDELDSVFNDFKMKYSTSDSSAASPPAAESNQIITHDEVNSYSYQEPHQEPESRVKWLSGVTDATIVQVDDQVQDIMNSILDQLSEGKDKELGCEPRESTFECTTNVADTVGIQVDNQVHEAMCSILDQLSADINGQPLRFGEVSINSAEMLTMQRSSRESSSAGPHKCASLLDPLEDWTFNSKVSIVTPVKAAPFRTHDEALLLTPVTHHEMSCQMTPVNHQELASQVTPVKQQEMSSEMTPVQLHEISSQMTPVGKRAVSSEMTPVTQQEMPSQMTPIEHKEVSSEMTPVKFTEMASEMTPVRHSEISSQMTPVGHKEVSSEMTPIRQTDMASHMTPIKLTDTGTCAATPVALNDGATFMTPIKHSDASSGTPIKMTDASICQTPVIVTHSATSVTPIHQANASTETSQVELVESGVTGTTIDFSDQGTLMTPVKHSDAALTCMTPVKMVDGCSETNTIELVETGMDPIPIDTSSLSTMTSPVKVAHVEVGTEQAIMVNAEVGMTPVRTVHSGCAMTPQQMIDNSTSITPVTVSEMETLTSPMAVPVYRWEADNPQNADPASLVDHLETASISNQLLRREVQMWTEKHTAVSQQLNNAREDLKQKRDHRRGEDVKANQMQSLAKASLEKDVEDLMSQIGEQMMQIGELQDQLQQKSRDIQAAHQEKAECQEQYQKEVHNLQEDLKTAYRQHQQQIVELEDQIKRNNYQPHYERSQETIKTLKMELEAYTGLTDTMQKATKIQEEFGCLEEAFTKVVALFQKTVAKKQIWQSENQAMQAQMETNQAQLSEAHAKLLQADSAKIQAEFEMQEAKLKEQASHDLNQTLHTKIDTANECIAELKKQLHATKLEALGFQEDFNKSSTQSRALQEANIASHLKEQSMGAALTAQANQWKDTELHMANMKKTMQAKIEELQQECQELTSTESELAHQLNMTHESKSVLQADLNLSRNTVDQHWDQIEAQTQELETLRYQQGQMRSKIKDLEDNTDFLEEERNALVDANKEADDHMRVTTLELSRCKVALEESEAARKQWEAAVEEITERLQETQSELDNTKAYAHWMLLNQATEMSEAAQGLQGIHQQIDVMKQQLKDTLGLDLMKEKELSPIKDTSTGCSLNSSSTSSGASSIVASVLSALQIKGSSTPKENSSLPASPLTGEGFNENISDYEQQDMALTECIRQSLGSGTNIVIGQSSGSAFTALKNSSSGSSSSRTPVRDPQAKSDSGGGRGPLLVDQVSQVGKLFGHILKGLIIQVSALQESLQEVHEERDKLQKNTTKSRQNFDSELALVQEQLHASECHERALHQELANTKAKLCDLEQNLQYGEQRIQVMAGNLARFSDQKYTIEKLKQEAKDKMTALRASELEKATLQQLLDNLASKVNGSDDGGHMGSQVYGSVVKENCKFKLEIEKLRLKVIERQDHYEALNTRANRQTKVLEGNWKKAEAEIYRLDDIFDKCKQLIQNVPDTEEEDHNLAALRQIFN